MGVKLQNKERFFRKLNSTVPGMQAELTVANAKSATDMVDLAKRLAPFEDGVLQDSVRMSAGPRPTAFTVEAGGPTTTKPVRNGVDAEYDYALGIEFSTQKMPAQPFFWPSFRVTKRTHKGRATRAIRKAIKAAGF